jgi:GNAT superfamily N-acetyltransferase
LSLVHLSDAQRRHESCPSGRYDVEGMHSIKDLVFREAYWDDTEARRAFQRFLIKIHGLDLGAWEAAGHWDDRYRPFSYFDGEGRVVSSVCVYSLEMTVGGSRCRAAQISGVGTLPERRKQGLNRRLTDIALEWSAPDHDFVFLFADEEAVPFYARCGFQSLEEQTPHVKVRASHPRPGMRLLDLADTTDLELVRNLAARREPVSETLGVLSRELFMFHALYTLRGRLHHVRDLDVIVALRREGSRTTVYDVVGSRVPRFDELSPYLATPGTTEVDFYFVPDRLEIDDLRWRPLRGNNLHDRGDFPLRGERFLFPFTAHA